MAKSITKAEILEAIEKCDKVISKQIEKKDKLQTKLAEIKKEEILDAIVSSGKSLEEVLAFVKS